MRTITRDHLKRRIESGDDLTVVDVLDSSDFEEDHLPGALSAPIHADSFDDDIRRLVPDLDAEVVVYCASSECDASEKAAARMIELGYTNVIDYEGGKEDWKQAGLPMSTGRGAASGSKADRMSSQPEPRTAHRSR